MHGHVNWLICFSDGTKGGACSWTRVRLPGLLAVRLAVQSHDHPADWTMGQGLLRDLGAVEAEIS